MSGAPLARLSRAMFSILTATAVYAHWQLKIEEKDFEAHFLHPFPQLLAVVVKDLGHVAGN